MDRGRRLSVYAGALAALLLTACSRPNAPSVTNTPAATPAQAGSIAGTLAYPSSGIPPMTIYAIPVETGRSRFFTVRTIWNQATYSIRGVEPGTYHLFAVPSAAFAKPPPHFMGAYTTAVACGLVFGCDDHTPVPVMVSASNATTGIAVTDFYAPPNSYPLVPKSGPTETLLTNPSASYPDAMAAALYEARRGTAASTVVQGAFDQCPRNDSCVALQAMHDGTRSAFFDAQAGSNSDAKACGVYVFQDAAGWHPLNTACGVYPAPGKSMSAAFMGSGCINARLNPGYAGKIVECLPVDTTVTIDGGPVFVQESTASDVGNLNRLWWHLVGHGWMVHQYLAGEFNIR
jgi:hypothetical protein